MAKSGFLLSRQMLATVSVFSLLAVTGCSTVEETSLASAATATRPSIQETPEEARTTVETIIPQPKPGTNIAAYVTPSTAENGAATAVAALAEGRTQTQAATESQIIQAAGDIKPAPVMVSMAVMDSDFDTGEPVGLETLVAKNMIVPVGKPQVRAVGYAATADTASPFSLAATQTSSRPELDRLIKHYADLNGIPVELVHRVVKRESTYNPRAYSKGNYGLMQIRYNTARGLGYKGPAEGLFDAETNLKYATKYLRGAWMVADGKHDGAVRLYARGYYYDAKRKGLLEATGLK